MCTGLEPLLLAGAGGFAASKLLAPSAPAAQPDPAAERAKSEAEAQQKANAKISMTRKAMRENSLLTGAGSGTLGAPAAAPAASARTTLGV